MRQLRIVQVVEHYTALGGIPEVVEHLVRELPNLGHQVAVATTRSRHEEGASRVERFAGAGAHYVRIPGAKPPSLRHLEATLWMPLERRAGSLARFIRRWRPDVVNSHIWRWDKLPTVAGVCRLAGVPLVHTWYDPAPWGVGRLGEKALQPLQRCAAIVTISKAARDFIERIIPQARDARVILGGTDVAALAEAPPYRRPRPYLFCCSRLDLRYKAIDQLLKAFAEIALEFPALDLLIGGDGPDRERLRRMSADLGLETRVEFTGLVERDRLNSLYKGAVAFAMPSRGQGEGLGLVFLEAMAAGIAVIATRSGGPAEIVTDRINGLLVDEDDSAALAQALRSLAGDPALRRSLAEAGRHYVEENRTWGRFAQQYSEVYGGCVMAARRRDSSPAPRC